MQFLRKRCNFSSKKRRKSIMAVISRLSAICRRDAMHCVSTKHYTHFSILNCQLSIIPPRTAPKSRLRGGCYR